MTVVPIVNNAALCDSLRQEHREIEASLDRFLKAFHLPFPQLVAEAQSAVQDMCRLSPIHFEKEEGTLYPRFRPLFPDLLAELDQQHEDVREVERHVVDLLADPPPAPDARWLNDVQLFGTELCDRIQHHIVQEEDQLFRLVETKLA